MNAWLLVAVEVKNYFRLLVHGDAICYAVNFTSAVKSSGKIASIKLFETSTRHFGAFDVRALEIKDLT